jgi:hypothetical protein
MLLILCSIGKNARAVSGNQGGIAAAGPAAGILIPRACLIHAVLNWTQASFYRFLQHSKFQSVLQCCCPWLIHCAAHHALVLYPHLIATTSSMWKMMHSMPHRWGHAAHGLQEHMFKRCIAGPIAGRVDLPPAALAGAFVFGHITELIAYDSK